jgi:hypothetical protein
LHICVALLISIGEKRLRGIEHLLEFSEGPNKIAGACKSIKTNSMHNFLSFSTTNNQNVKYKPRKGDIKKEAAWLLSISRLQYSRLMMV